LSKSLKLLLLLEPGSINNNNSNNNIKLLSLIKSLESLPLIESLESLKSLVILAKPCYSEDNKNLLLNVYNNIIIYNLDIYKYN
jgi:hypothetical protein